MRCLRQLLVATCASLLVAACASPPQSPVQATPTTAAQTGGSVTGKVLLQGRLNHEGVRITLGLVPAATSLSDGSFAWTGGIPTGQHVIRAEKAGYLSAEGSVLIELPGQSRSLPVISLVAGDINGDGLIDLLDLVLVAAHVDDESQSDPLFDLTADGAVDSRDLALIGNNLGQTGPLPFA